MDARGAVVAALLGMFPATLAAQTCMGGASFADRRAQGGVGTSVSAGAQSASAGLSLGSAPGPFAAVDFGLVHDHDLSDNAMVFAATAGMGMPLRPRPKTQLCPFISVVALSGAELGDGETLSTQAFGLGASVGRIINPAPEFEIVPSLTAAFVTEATTIHTTSPRVTLAENHQGYSVSLGAGLVWSGAITIRPFTTIGVAEGQTTRSYGVRISVGFGAVKTRVPVREGEGSSVLVWLNTRTGTYYCPASRWYGATAYGEFMTEREALARRAEPEFGRRC